MDDDSQIKGGFFSLFSRKNAEGNDKEEVIEEEIASMLNEGQDCGVINKSEAEMITNIFRLDDIEASEIMVHRKSIIALNCESTLEEAVNIIANASFSRFPVYDTDIDNITGMIHIKDVFCSYVFSIDRSKKIKDIDGILRKVLFVPETSKIDTIFRNMQSKKTHLVIVVDEYGQTAGLLAMEDILEKIVGNIFDEHDKVEFNITRISDNVYQVNGLTPLDEISSECGIIYPENDYETLNGYLISKLDRIPENDVGTVIEDENVRYTIISVDNKTISAVKIEIQPEKKTNQEE